MLAGCSGRGRRLRPARRRNRRLNRMLRGLDARERRPFPPRGLGGRGRRRLPVRGRRLRGALFGAFPQRLAELLGKLRQKPRHRAGQRGLLQLALPDHVHAPAHRLKSGQVLGVALHVARELRLPIRDVFLRRAGIAVRAAMPIAAAHLDGHALARPGDIRMPRHLPLQTIAAQARLAQLLAHKQLGLGVLALVALHALVDGPIGRRRGGHAGNRVIEAAGGA